MKKGEFLRNRPKNTMEHSFLGFWLVFIELDATGESDNLLEMM